MLSINIIDFSACT